MRFRRLNGGMAQKYIYKKKPTYCSVSPTIVTSPYVWNIWERDFQIVTHTTNTNDKKWKVCLYKMHVSSNEKSLGNVSEVLVKGFKSRSVAACIFIIIIFTIIKSPSIIFFYMVSPFLDHNQISYGKFKEFIETCQPSVPMMFGGQLHHVTCY